MVPRPALVAALEQEPAVAFVLDRDLAIRYVNPAWSLPAEAPSEPASLLSRPYLSFVVGPMRAILERRLVAALAPETGALGIFIVSECNTPTQVRKLRTQVVPLRPDEGGPPEGLLLVHHLHVEGPLADRSDLPAESPELWRTADGLLVQCGCCRRARDARTGAWRMSLSLVGEARPNTSHGLCSTCLEAYYPSETIKVEHQLEDDSLANANRSALRAG